MAKRYKRFLFVLLGLIFGGLTRPLHVTALENPPLLAATAPDSWTSPAQSLATSLQQIPDTFEIVGENDTFQLYANRTTLAFKVVDKRSGYVWHSNLDEKGEDDRLNKTWTAFAQSGISIDYLDAKATNERASISNSEPLIDFKPIDQGFEASVTFTAPSITILVRVTLGPDGVRVEVPFEAIQESDPEFKLGLMYVYPFFGATRGDSIPGYMFIPDGSGSLIRFTAETKAANMFYGRYYGADLGMIAELPWDPLVNRAFKLSIPVIGMAHGEQEHAYIAVVEKGAAYGEVHAHPSGIITNFNFLYNAFVYNESFFQATNRAGAGVTTLQPKTNAFDIAIQYRFLTGAEGDYVGMANSYQQYLVENGVLQKISPSDENIGIRLEFLGGEKERILFWHRSIPMTTVSQMGEIVGDLEVKNPDIIYYGWQPGGAASMPPKKLKLDRKLGTVGQLQDLVETITAKGGSFSLYVDPQAAIRDEKGYSTRNDLAMSITNFNLIGYNRSKVNFYLNLDTLTERYPALSEDVFSQTGAGLALDGIGSMVYSDFKKNHVLNRGDAILSYQALLADSAGRTSFYRPNDYMFPYTSAYYDMPLSNSGYIYTTDVVPFLQIVLAGYIPYYGPALNFSSNLQEDLLKHVDFGVYPSYFLTHEITAKILNTSSNWIFTSSYAQWGQEIEETYAWLNALLGPVKGQRIVARAVLGEGVSATTYENGQQIIVNFSEQDFSEGALTVSGKDAVIREVAP